ncbi:MAG: hypothetical protein Q7R77_02125 [Candidatus Daviesbacteria bacterium]|nr:hypothetical protein [Candidatus Daviesbacteria bacterium]
MKKEIIKFYSKYRLYIFPAIVSLSSLFLIVFAIYPQTMKLIAGQKSTEKLINRSKLLDIKVAALENLNDKDLSRKVELVLNALPPEKDFGNTFALLQQLVIQPGFSMTSITVSNSSAKVGNSDSFDVKLELKGPRILLSTILNNLDNSPRLIRVKSIDVSSNQGQQNVDVALALQVLYAALPQNYGMIDSPLPELSQNDEGLISTLESIKRTIPATAESPRGKSNPFE